MTVKPDAVRPSCSYPKCIAPLQILILGILMPSGLLHVLPQTAAYATRLQVFQFEGSSSRNSSGKEQKSPARGERCVVDDTPTVNVLAGGRMCSLRRRSQVLGSAPAEQLGTFEQTWKIWPVHRPGRPNSAGCLLLKWRWYD